MSDQQIDLLLAHDLADEIAEKNGSASVRGAAVARCILKHYPQIAHEVFCRLIAYIADTIECYRVHTARQHYIIAALDTYERQTQAVAA